MPKPAPSSNRLTVNRPWLLVFGQAAVVFGPENAMRWMKRRCLALDNLIPADLATTPSGRKKVLAELGRCVGEGNSPRLNGALQSDVTLLAEKDKPSRLVRELAKLNPHEERRLSEEGVGDPSSPAF
jgi:hypothetical protein